LDVILPFHSVITNVGGAYNPTTGVFTCPFDGEYYFSVVANVWDFDHNSDVLYLIKNGIHIAAADKDDATSTVVVMTWWWDCRLETRSTFSSKRTTAPWTPATTTSSPAFSFDRIV
jgi:hypothetical protein